MKSYGIQSIRNVGLFGHQGVGKTSLADALLYVSGAIDRLGRTDEGTSTCDFDAEEQKRRISIKIGQLCRAAPASDRLGGQVFRGRRSPGDEGIHRHRQGRPVYGDSGRLRGGGASLP